MACHPLTDTTGKRRVGFICTADTWHHLGPGIYMEWHNYLGPSFYSDKDYSKPIDDWWKKPRVLAAFEKWQKENRAV